jgi:alpha-mannosidase
VFRENSVHALVIDDKDTTTWSHNKFVFDQVIGTFGNAELYEIEKGELTATIRAISTYGKSMLTQDFTMYRDTPDIDVKVRLNWQEEDTMLKFGFDAGIKDGKAVYEIPFGNVEKAANGEEEVAQQWAAVTNGDQTLAVATNAKYSFSLKDGELRFVAVRSPVYCYHGDYRDSLSERTDIGLQEFEYSIIPQNKLNTAKLTQKAIRLNNKPHYVLETFHKGILPMDYTGIEIDRENIILTACKASEEGNGTVLRLYEGTGTEISVSVNAPVIGARFDAVFSPFEIKTFLVDKQGNVTETNLLELE